MGLERRYLWLVGLVLVMASACGGRDESITPTPLPMIDAGSGEVPADAGVAPAPEDAAVVPATLVVQRAVPDHGPFTGGTRSILRGGGFTADAIVTVGGRMVQPADTDVIDDHRLSIVVPAGEVGPADITVTVGDSEVTLPAGFTYDAFYLDPDRGAVSGGTYVTVIGSGTAFADGDEVVFGRSPCVGVVIESESRLTCKTPAGAVGSVDVTIRHAADGTEIVAEDGFTYYDSADPFGGGLGGGSLNGSLNVTVLNAASGEPVPDAFVILGEDLTTEFQNLTDIRGQVTFSSPELIGDQTVHVAKHCFEKTSVVAFDAADVTVFLVPWMDPMCGMGGGPPPPGRGRNGSFISGELVWLGPNEYGPNPWANVPDPRAGEVKVAYVYTTQVTVDVPNPDPALGGGPQRVREIVPNDGQVHVGYPYGIFARPAGLAVYALAGLENTRTATFVPYVMGVARNVLVGPGETATDVNVLMNIPLDQTVDVRMDALPSAGRTGPDRFLVEGYLDLGGEGVIVREVNGDTLDAVRGRSAERPFRLFAQPSLVGALADARYLMTAGWYTGAFEAQPFTTATLSGVRDVRNPVVFDGYLGIPQATSPGYGENLPADRMLRWEADGAEPDFHMVLLIGGDGNPAWRHFAPGDVREVPIPDLSTIPEIDDVSGGFLSWVVYAIKIPGFRYDELSYRHLNERYWSHSATDVFTALY